MPIEPEYPHDAPTVAELSRWFAWSVGAVLGGAGGMAALVWGTARTLGVARLGRGVLWIFAGAAFLLGLLGTTLVSPWANAFVLTWPVSLYVAFRGTLGVVAWVEAKPIASRPRWISRLATVAFVAICYGYYHVCLAIGYVMAWGFLGGFLPAAPFAVVAARVRNPWGWFLSEAVAFSVYFWASGLIPGAKDWLLA
jgi:hypothetical protein